jgi:hypothetical protein
MENYLCSVSTTPNPALPSSLSGKAQPIPASIAHHHLLSAHVPEPALRRILARRGAPPPATALAAQPLVDRPASAAQSHPHA